MFPFTAVMWILEVEYIEIQIQSQCSVEGGEGIHQA